MISSFAFEVEKPLVKMIIAASNGDDDLRNWPHFREDIQFLICNVLLLTNQQHIHQTY